MHKGTFLNINRDIDQIRLGLGHAHTSKLYQSKLVHIETTNVGGNLIVHIYMPTGLGHAHTSKLYHSK